MYSFARLQRYSFVPVADIVSWEPERHYHYSTMIHIENQKGDIAEHNLDGHIALLLLTRTSMNNENALLALLSADDICTENIKPSSNSKYHQWEQRISTQFLKEDKPIDVIWSPLRIYTMYSMNSIMNVYLYSCFVSHILKKTRMEEDVL